MSDQTAIFAAFAVLADQYQQLLIRADDLETRLNEATERLNAHGLLLVAPRSVATRRYYENLLQQQEAA